jgi:hypothetical protein
MTKRKALADVTVLTAYNGQQRVVNPGGICEPDAIPLVELPDDGLVHALVQPLSLSPVTPAPVAAPQRPRRISAEVVKAETKLIQLERSREESLRNHALSWDAKRTAYIQALPEDVRAALVAMRVLEPADD